MHSGEASVNEWCKIDVVAKLTVTFCWSRYLLKYDRAAYVRTQASNLARNLRSSGDLSQVSLGMKRMRHCHEFDMFTLTRCSCEEDVAASSMS